MTTEFNSAGISAGGITNQTLSTQFVTKDVTKRKWYGKKTRILEHGVDMAMASIVSTEGNVLLESEGDLNNVGAQITAMKTIQGLIKGDINLTSAVEEVHNQYQKRGFSGLSLSSNKNKNNAFYESHSQLLGNNINLKSETGEINAAGALIASAETTELTTKDGDINLDAQTNDYYSESSGWSIGVSFGGSNIVDAALKGGSVSDLVDAYAQTNALAGALSTLANADGKQTRQALINASLGVKKGGQSLLTAFNADNPAALTDSLNNTLNPFKSLTEPALGGLTVSMGRHKSRNDWQDSQQTRIYGGKNIIIEAGGKGKLNQLGGTILSTNIESLSEELSHSAGNNTAHALAALWEQGDQYTDPDEQSINLSGAQGINIIGLTETASSESSNTGVDVTFTGAGLAGISGVSLNHNESQSNSTRVTQGHIDSDGGQITYNTGAGSDLLIQGAVIDVGATHYNVGGDVIVESLQDTEETNNQGFGVSASFTGGANSLSVNQGRTDRSEVTEQSGIYSSGGVSGRIGGNVVLNGGVMINDGGPNTVELGGSVITTDLSNRARIESQGLSIGLGGGQTADNGEGKGKGSSNPLSNLSLPSHRDDGTDSTTYAVLDGITFPRPDGRTVDTQDIRSEIDGANERLEIPGEEDNNSLAIFAGTLLSVEITNQIGSLGMFQNGQNENQGWQEGGGYKALAHLANGALTNLLTGGDSRDSLSAGLSAAAVEMAMPYLSTGNQQTDQQVAGLFGGIVSHATGGDFDSGAISGSVADAFNRQMHEKEIKLIKANAATFARQQNGGKPPTDAQIQAAIATLTQQALWNVDLQWRFALGVNNSNEEANEFLTSISTAFDGDGTERQAFTQDDDFMRSGVYNTHAQTHAAFLNQAVPTSVRVGTSMEDIGTYLANGGEEALGLVKNITDDPKAYLDKLLNSIDEKMTALDAELAEKGLDGVALEAAQAALSKVKADLAGLILEDGTVVLSALADNHTGDLTQIDLLGLEAIYGDEAAQQIAMTLALIDAAGTVAAYTGIKAVLKQGGLTVAELAEATKRQLASNAKACSFHGDTQVLTRAGYQAIRDLNAGIDQVWSRNEYTGEMDWKAIQAQYANPYPTSVSVTLRDAQTGAVQTIVSNRIHPYFVQRNPVATTTPSSEGHDYQGKIPHGHWIDAQHLAAGDRLLNANEQWSDVVSITIKSTALHAYNLTVMDFHTYFVAGQKGMVGVWVHNKCWDALPEGATPIDDKGEFLTADNKLGYKGADGRYYTYEGNPRTDTDTGNRGENDPDSPEEVRQAERDAENDYREGAPEAENISVVRVNAENSTIKGSADYEILNNPPPNSRVELENGTTFRTGEGGYVDEITYKPVDNPGVRDSRQTPVGKEGVAGDVGGHIQACRHEGSCDRFNLFPQNSNFNGSAYKTWENEITRSLTIPSPISSTT